MKSFEVSMLSLCSHYARKWIHFGWVYFVMITSLYADVIPGEGECVKVCLVMMTQNDEAVIEECLKSVKEVIDCISIRDLGSTDRTCEIIEHFMQETSIPGIVYDYKDGMFERDQTLMVQDAQDTLFDLGISSTNCYLLTLEPDMKIIIGPSFSKNLLSQDAYSVLETSKSKAYSRYTTRLLKASLPWESTDLVDGSWSCKGSRSMLLDNLFVMDEQMGERKKSQLKREIASLQEALKKEAGKESHLFHLAQSYKGLQEYQKAIDSYQARIATNAKSEEVWFSKFMIGECYRAMNQWEQALFWYLEAYQHDPSRPESLQKISHYYQLKREFDLSYLFAKHGLSIPYPQDIKLTSYPPLYEHQFDEELSISAFYTSHRDEGWTALNELILRKNVPWWTKNLAYQNLLFYVKPLEGTRFQKVDIETPLIREGYEERYHPMNSSICKTEDGYRLFCSAVNYSQKDAKHFTTIDEKGYYRSRNYLVKFDRELNQLSQHQIIENLIRDRYPSFHAVEGLYDSRLFRLNEEYWFTCNTYDTNPFKTIQISLCKLTDSSDEKTIFVEKLIPLHGPDPKRCEKNWLPFIHEGHLFAVYSYDPFIIYEPDLKTGHCKTVFEYVPEHDFSRFRGSAPPVPFDQGYLILVHEVIQLTDWERRYVHRFAYINENFMIEKVSTPFTFRHLGIEYCCGMTIDHSGRKMVIAVSEEDHDAFLCTIDLSIISSLLHPLPSY